MVATDPQRSFTKPDMNEPLLEIPRELDPSFDAWMVDYADYAWCHDSAGIEDYDGETLCIGVSGGEYERKGRALASKAQLKRLAIDGRNIPQPLIDAAGEIPSLERLQLGNIGPRSLSPLARLADLRSLYLEGIKGAQQLSVNRMTKLESLSIGGDSDAVVSLLREGHANIRCLQLWGTGSANLKLRDLELLRGLPNIEHLVLGNLSVSSRSLEPCLTLPRLRQVILNFARSWDRDSILAVKAKGTSVRFRMDEFRTQSS